MIKFSTVIDNFDRVYKAQAQKEGNLFLNSSLELVNSPSQKASFFDIMSALQFQKWDVSSESISPSEISKSIKRISVQAKLIYHNDPFFTELSGKYVELLNKSICQEIFLDKAKLEEYSEEIHQYCETLYFYKLLIEAEEKLIAILDSDNLKLPQNLEEFNKFAEELFQKIFFLIHTKEFSYLREAKYSDPLLYLSVFIEGDEKNIKKTYPEILHMLEMAELIYTKQQLQSTKKTFTAAELREKFLSIHQDPIFTKIKKKNLKDKFFFMAGYSGSITPFFTDIDKYKDKIKVEISKLENDIQFYENELKILEDNIYIGTQHKLDFSKDVYTLQLCLREMKKNLHTGRINLFCFQQFPFLQIQDTYIKSFKKLIATLKMAKLHYSNIGSIKRKERPLKEYERLNVEKIVENCKRVPIEPSLVEQKIVQEHFPALIQEKNYTSSQEKLSNLKIEITKAKKIYALLMLELSKAQSLNPSLKEKTSVISSNYTDLIKLLSGNENPSLPSAEKFNEMHSSEWLTPFFSDKDIKHIDELILYFQKITVKNLRIKIKGYSEEYLRLQSTKKVPIKRPKAISKNSFVASSTLSKKNELVEPPSIGLKKDTKTQIEVSTGAIPKTKISETKIISSQPSTVTTAEKEDMIPDQEKIKCSLTSTIIEDSSAIEENVHNDDTVDFLVLETKKKKKASYNKKKLLNRSSSEQDHKTLLSSATSIDSLKRISSVTVQQKIPAIFYNEHVNRWFSGANEAVDDPKYAGFNVTNEQKKQKIAYHAFPLLIDSLIETNYSLKKIEIDPKDGSITRYGIPGTILLDTKKHHGIFEYTINSNNICFHRCFSRKTDNFEKTKPLTISRDSQKQIHTEHFYFGKTPVEFNPRRGEITIKDSKNNVEFTIVHPDDYWKLPNKITNIS